MNLTYQGYGRPSAMSDSYTYYGHSSMRTFEDCAYYCKNRRKYKGESWNGIQFQFGHYHDHDHDHHKKHDHHHKKHHKGKDVVQYSRNKCICIKDDNGGTTYSETDLHYKFD